jgi:hypothetical protein
LAVPSTRPSSSVTCVAKGLSNAAACSFPPRSVSAESSWCHVSSAGPRDAVPR